MSCGKWDSGMKRWCDLIREASRKKVSGGAGGGQRTPFFINLANIY